MQFDARTAKAMLPGQHMVFDNYPGLRLSAMAKVRTWFYRYRSTVDGCLRQVSIGHWPSMSFPAAIVAWEALKNQRNSGSDPALAAKLAKLEAKALIKKQEADKTECAYTVRVLCDEYLVGHVCRHRAKKGSIEITRMFNTMLGDIADLPSTAIT